jgi:hypothetical protein
MTLATFAALDAFEAALTGVDDLPAVDRHDSALEGFTDSGTPGIRWLLALEEGDFDPAVAYMGDPPEHEVWAEAELVFAVEGPAGESRDTVLRAGLVALAGVMMPGGHGLRIDGKFEDLRIDRIERRLIQREAGTQPIDLVSIPFALFVTAPTPFG